MYHFTADNFDVWRAQARDMIARNILPNEVSWGDKQQPSMFATQPNVAYDVVRDAITIPKDFFSLAKAAGCHRDTRKWDLLYQLLWRMSHGEKNLLRITTDPVMQALRLMEKAVRRDTHKMHAFVRFRLVKEDGRDHYIAWHKPDHLIVERASPFFMRRFGPMEWTILTPDASAHWDGNELTYGAGATAGDAPDGDVLEDLWRTYYRHIFNPARIKIKMMKSEMPVRHWATLPETKIIQEMLAEAPARVEKMLKHSEGLVTSAAEFLPQARDIEHLRMAAKACQGCELSRCATQTVFGEGAVDAPLMIVGEQPGNEEDMLGRPFVGPAGHILDEALEEAGLSRLNIYITNAVKHFRYLLKANIRTHQSPNREHIQACKPWLNAEIAAIKPKAILCLGNTAARSLISPGFTMKIGRGKFIDGLGIDGTPALIASYHPASILRTVGAQAAEQKKHLFDDLKTVAKFIAV